MTTEALALEAESVCLAFGKRVVLQDVNLAAQPGTSVALLGPSGAGKTTLLWCVAGMVRPDRGRIAVAGQQMHPSREGQRRRLRREHLGMVLQGGELVPELTARDNVRVGGMLAGLGAAEASKRTDEMLAALGIAGDVADRRAATLSGGERQRVAIARGLVHRPAVLLADEPTAALDDVNAAVVIDLLAKLPRAIGCTVVSATHDARLATALDAVVQIDHRGMRP